MKSFGQEAWRLRGLDGGLDGSKMNNEAAASLALSFELLFHVIPMDENFLAY